jgi:uncharacterized protein
MSMKYLLVTTLIVVVFWLWRHNREVERDEARRKREPVPHQPSPEATEVVACAVCQVHLPRTDALPGRNGFYCGDAHRRQAGG